MNINNCKIYLEEEHTSYNNLKQKLPGLLKKLKDNHSYKIKRNKLNKNQITKPVKNINQNQ
jgi:hypothetical protein